MPRAIPGEAQDLEARILNAIELKRKKGGAAYASGKTLVVFLNAGGGQWFPNKVAKLLPKALDFDDAWVVGLLGVEAGEYVYGITQLDAHGGNAPTSRVRIGKNFDEWEVERLQ